MAKKKLYPEGYITYLQRHMTFETLLGKCYYGGITVTITPIELPKDPVMVWKRYKTKMTLQGPKVSVTIETHDSYWNLRGALREVIDKYNEALTDAV